MATATLVPTGDVATSGVTKTGTFADIDEGTTSPNDADFVQLSSFTAGIATFDFTDMPSDFGSITDLDLRVRYKSTGWTDDTYVLSASIYSGAGVIWFTSGGPNTVITGANQATFTTAAFTAPSLTGAALLASKTEWDAAVMRIDLSRTTSMSVDAIIVQISAMQADITYTPANFSPLALLQYRPALRRSIVW